ncbi:MAG: hypothetical protein ACYTBX_00895 [Planctomycetota bacterium]
MKLAKKQMYRKCIVVLICLLMVGNLAHGAVLCFGSDGHIEIESAFHERCDDPAGHSYASDQNLSYETDHEKDKHCEPCVDIPISIGLAKVFRTPKQLNPTFPVPATNNIVLIDKFNFSACNSAPNTFGAASYFTPLRTVILLV